jgi:glycylpeptide N-tetradecanoyltransferase
MSIQVPTQTHIPGLREMEKKDLKQVSKLLRCYMARFDVAQNFSNKEVEHMFIAGRGTGEVKNGRRQGQVTWSYVVEVSRIFLLDL